MSQLAGGASVAGEQPAVQHNAAAHARAERDHNGAFRVPPAAEERLAQRGGVGIVAEADGQAGVCAQCGAQVKALKIQIRRIADDSRRIVYRAGAANAHAADGGAIFAAAKLRDQIRHAPGDRRVAQLNVRGNGMLPQDLALRAHERALDVCAAEINADIIHDKSPPGE